VTDAFRKHPQSIGKYRQASAKTALKKAKKPFDNNT
jgi:hypothetical protein